MALLAAYFSVVWVPLVVLLSCMIVDYVSGLMRAYIAKTLSSSRGIRGILKKAGYLLVVASSVVCDWVISSGILGVQANFFIASLVIVWLILNEVLSILENMMDIGVPFPSFLVNIVDSLQKMSERKAENTNDDKH